MASVSPGVQTTNLEELYNSLCKTPFEIPFIGLDSGFRAYMANRFHEAGFDAYASGTIYLKLLSNISSKITNIIPISRSDSHLVLDGADSVPDRSRVFHVSGLPDFHRHIVEEKITRQFSQYGSVAIAWIDEVSVFVTVNPPNRGMLVPIDERLRKEICSATQYKIITFDVFHGVQGKR